MLTRALPLLLALGACSGTAATTPYQASGGAPEPEGGRAAAGQPEPRGEAGEGGSGVVVAGAGGAPEAGAGGLLEFVGGAGGAVDVVTGQGGEFVLPAGGQGGEVVTGGAAGAAGAPDEPDPSVPSWKRCGNGLICAADEVCTYVNLSPAVGDERKCSKQANEFNHCIPAVNGDPEAQAKCDALGPQCSQLWLTCGVLTIDDAGSHCGNPFFLGQYPNYRGPRYSCGPLP
jgi:hypothetical protein